MWGSGPGGRRPDTGDDWRYPASVSIWRGRGLGREGLLGRGGGGGNAKQSLAPGTQGAATPHPINSELPGRGLLSICQPVPQAVDDRAPGLAHG